MLRRLFGWMAGAALQGLGRGRAAALIAGSARRLAGRLEPGEALRFLFDLDSRLYALQTNEAVAYGGGLHTRHRHTCYHDFFAERITPDETVLDIGCGNGAVACDIAVRTGARVTGIDLSAENIRQARQRACPAGMTFLHGDVLRELPGDHYDVVILSNVLEHLEERSAFLKRVQHAATPERFMVRVPLFERDWRVPLKKELGVEWRLDPTHCTEYTLESFRQEVEAAELDVVHLEVRWGEIWCELRAVPE